MDGLVPGRVVYYVFSVGSASEVMRRRTTGPSIADRMHTDPPTWPVGAQAHLGTPIAAGDICPAIVVRVVDPAGVVNLKVLLDGSDEYWATSVAYVAGETPTPHSWHWMFSGQQGRYTPQSVRGGAL